MSLSAIMFTGDKVKDAKLLETNGVFQRFLSNISGMNMGAECGITGVTPITLSTLMPEPAVLPIMHTQQEAEDRNIRMLNIKKLNMEITKENNKISQGKADVSVWMLTAVSIVHMICSHFSMALHNSFLTSDFP